jgi:hypothetical protein
MDEENLLTIEDYQTILDALYSKWDNAKMNIRRYSTGEMAGKYPHRLTSYQQQYERLDEVIKKFRAMGL